MDSEIIFDIYLMPEFWVFFGWIFISLEDRRIDFAIKLMLIYVKIGIVKSRLNLFVCLFTQSDIRSAKTTKDRTHYAPCSLPFSIRSQLP